MPVSFGGSGSPAPATSGTTPFSKAEYESRINKTLALLEEERLDALLCYASKIIPGNVRYLTGYETRLGIHDASYFLITPNTEPPFTLFSNASWEHPEELSWVQDVVVSSDFGREIAARLPSSTARLGVAGYRYLPVPVYLAIKDRLQEVEIVDVTQSLMRLRWIKSPEEIQVLRRCAQITDSGGKAFLNTVRAGVTERAIAAEVERAMKLNGSEEVSFTTQVGCGERTWRVVVYPGDAALQEGDPVQLDCGAKYFGYLGDLSRVAVVGHPDSEYRRMLDTVEEMYWKCLEAVRPGVEGSRVAEIGIAVAKSHRLEEFLYRSPNHRSGFLAHGIGCHYGESPELTPEDPTVLEENMVLVIEPILMRPGVGGVKIEDAVLVTGQGAERFSSCEVNTWAKQAG